MFNGTVCISGEPSCDPGTAFDGTEYGSIDDPICSVGLTWNDPRCVSEIDPICIPGSRWNASFKDGIAGMPSKYPPGQRLKGGVGGTSCTMASGDCMEFEYCPTGSARLLE